MKVKAAENEGRSSKSDSEDFDQVCDEFYEESNNVNFQKVASPLPTSENSRSGSNRSSNLQSVQENITKLKAHYSSPKQTGISKIQKKQIIINRFARH